MAIATLSLTAMVLLAAAAGLFAQSSAGRRLVALDAMDRNITAALELSLTVRDVYAHQAHTIVINDRSHLDHYGESVLAAKNLLIALEGFLLVMPSGDAAVPGGPSPEDRLALARLRADIDFIDATFREAVVPAIGGAREALVAPHELTLRAVDRITHTVDALTVSVRARMDQARRAAQAEAAFTRAVLVALAVLAVLAAAWIAWRTSRLLGPPLAALARGAERFASGDLAHRIPVPVAPTNELAALARQMNAMAEDLARHQAQLVEAETLASVGRLAAGVAHEVNNPLAAILGFARLLERQPEARADAGRIAREAERCRDIVKGLLELSRPVRLQRAPVDVAAVAELVAEINEGFEAAGLAAAKVAVSGAAVVDADLARLRQVLWNLMKNAHEAGGAVTVTIAGERRTLTVTVDDDGPGLPPDVDPAHLFEPFVSSREGGTGLGLAISRGLARAHGGELRAEPNPAGRGARFVLVLGVPTP